jgi:3-oxoacyl-[acyl-carrier-protein] synthase-3
MAASISALFDAFEATNKMVFLHGVGHFHPDNVIDNSFLERLNIGTNDEWIMERVGIRQRRTVLPLAYIQQTYNKNPLAAVQHALFSNAQTAAKAATMALARANLAPENIGMVIAGGCLPQYSMPAEACLIAAELGITAPAFDINSACSTFAVHMHVVKHMHSEALPDYILLVTAENMTRAIDYSDRRTAVLWGDGAAAAVVSKKIKSPVSITHTMMASSPADWNKVIVPAGGHFQQEGPSVQKFAIRKTFSTLEHLRAAGNLHANQHYFIGHQANLMMLSSVCKMAGIAEEKHLYNVDQFGNCGAAGAASVLSQNWSRFAAGDTIALVPVGAGLTWGGMVIQVA